MREAAPRQRAHEQPQRYIGDAARDLARLLPGQWHASVEIYAHPAWQEDLVPWIWDSGDLGRAVQSERIPYAAVLTDAAQGTTLLFVERPGHHLGYLVGAFSPEGLEGGYGDPHAPPNIVLPPFPGRAAQALTDRYLPAYEQAVHARQTAAIAGVLADIRSEHDAWQAMNASGSYSDATPLGAAALGASTELFLDHAWRRFLTVVDHAPTLLDRCQPATSPWPDDASALSRLADAVSDAEALLDEIVHGDAVPEQERRARAWPRDRDVAHRRRRVLAPGPPERTPPPPGPPRHSPSPPPRRGPAGVPQPLTVPHDKSGDSRPFATRHPLLLRRPQGTRLRRLLHFLDSPAPRPLVPGARAVRARSR
ncbi:hypothetical protein R2F25_09645 [Streptomyces sp. UP1A-1]|nr:hypothetical protein [Streptomyces sp. UP1A-1]